MARETSGMHDKLPVAKQAPAFFARSVKVFSAVGVIAAVIAAANVNVLVSRFYKRWDVTSEGLYTLSHATTSVLKALPDTIEVIVLLSRGDAVLPRVRQMLTAYRAETSKLDIKYVDPERSPVEFSAIQQKYKILAGQAEDGRVVTDAVIVLSRGETRWFITADDITAFDDEGRARPMLEQALTEGLLNVTQSERIKLCFSEGHRETSLDDVGPDGLAELRNALEKNNYDLVRVNLEEPDSLARLTPCRALFVVDPDVALSAGAAARAEDFVKAGGSALVFASPLYSGGKVQASGLEPIARLAGAELGQNVILETDPSARLPRGVGDVFFAVPKNHPLSHGLVQEDKVDFRVLLSEAQSVKALDNTPAKAVLGSSEQAVAVDDLEPLLKGKDPPADAKRGSFSLAVAAELPKPPNSKERYGPRLVLVGASNPPGNHSFRDPAFVGDRLFVENAVAWATARPALVTVPEKAAHDVGLSLTEDSQREVLRYVLVYMPAVGVLLGVLVFLERRRHEKKSRARPAGETAS